MMMVMVMMMMMMKILMMMMMMMTTTTTTTTITTTATHGRDGINDKAKQIATPTSASVNTEDPVRQGVTNGLEGYRPVHGS